MTFTQVVCCNFSHIPIGFIRNVSTAVCVDLARLKPKSCAHENYVVKPLFNLNWKPCTWFYSCALLFRSDFARSTQTAVLPHRLSNHLV